MSSGDSAWGTAPNTPFWLVSRDRSIPLYPGAYVLGRSVDAEISFPNDPLVSRRHARLVVTPRSVEVEDLGSSNGTWVGSEMVQHQMRVPEGSKLRLGQQSLELRRTHTAHSRHNAMTSPELIAPRAIIPKDDALLDDDVAVETATRRGSPIDIVYVEAVEALGQGRVQEALGLVVPLLDLLAKSEPRVDTGTLEKAGYLALRLGAATGRGDLIDWAVTHHRMHAHTMTGTCLDQLEAAARAGVAIDRAELDEYMITLRRSNDDAAQLAGARLARLPMAWRGG